MLLRSSWGWTFPGSRCAIFCKFHCFARLSLSITYAISSICMKDREIIRVIVDCCLQEKMFNKYYAVLASKLCSHDKNHKFSLQVLHLSSLLSAQQLSYLTNSWIAALLMLLVDLFFLVDLIGWNMLHVYIIINWWPVNLHFSTIVFCLWCHFLSSDDSCNMLATCVLPFNGWWQKLTLFF